MELSSTSVVQRNAVALTWRVSTPRRSLGLPRIRCSSTNRVSILHWERSHSARVTTTAPWTIILRKKSQSCKYNQLQPHPDVQDFSRTVRRPHSQPPASEQVDAPAGMWSSRPPCRVQRQHWCKTASKCHPASWHINHTKRFLRHSTQILPASCFAQMRV